MTHKKRFNALVKAATTKRDGNGAMAAQGISYVPSTASTTACIVVGSPMMTSTVTTTQIEAYKQAIEDGTYGGL